MFQRPSPKIPANSMIPGDQGEGVLVPTGKQGRVGRQLAERIPQPKTKHTGETRNEIEMDMRSTVRYRSYHPCFGTDFRVHRKRATAAALRAACADSSPGLCLDRGVLGP